MNCDDCIDRLQQFVDRELSPEEIAEVRLHLDHCPPCNQLFRFEASIRMLVRNACCEQAPDSLRIRILSRSKVASFDPPADPLFL